MTAITKKIGLTNAEALVKLIGLVSNSVWKSLKIWKSQNLKFWEVCKSENLKNASIWDNKNVDLQPNPKQWHWTEGFGFPRGRNLVKAEVELRLKPNRSWSWVSSFLQSVLKNMKKGMSFQTAGRTFHCPQPCVCRSRVEVEVWWRSMPSRSRPGNRFD